MYHPRADTHPITSSENKQQKKRRCEELGICVGWLCPVSPNTTTEDYFKWIARASLEYTLLVSKWEIAQIQYVKPLLADTVRPADNSETWKSMKPESWQKNCFWIHHSFPPRSLDRRSTEFIVSPKVVGCRGGSRYVEGYLILFSVN